MAIPRSIRTGVLVAAMVLHLLGVAALPPTAQAHRPAVPRLQQATDIITARLGISPGDANQGLRPGTDRRELEQALPELFETATALGVGIDTVSVGRGFFWGDHEVEAEADLDLIVTGRRPNVLALGATFGQRWGQSVVFVWELRDDGEMLIASGEILSGLDQMDVGTFQALGTELPDGGHLKYAGAESLLVVANVGMIPEEEFGARMGRAQRVLEQGGIRTGELTRVQATMVELNHGNYQRFIDDATRSAPAVSAPVPAASPAAAPVQLPR